MKKFKFRLERVLQYKETVQAERKRELAFANTQLQGLQDQLEALKEEQLKNGQSANSAADLELARMYAHRLEELVTNTSLAIIEAEKAVEEAQEAYREASTEVESLAMLKQRKNEEFLQMVAEEEAKALDELTVQRYRFTRPERG